MPAERLRLFDDALRSRYGVRHLVGVDEVGRGPLAGPVLAAAVILPAGPLPALDGVRDSKKLSPARREKLYKPIRAAALQVGVGWSSPAEIDSLNILQATFLAMRRALAAVDLSREGLLVVVDGDKAVPGVGARQEALVAADAYSLSVAAASIVAKVLRDRWMGLLHCRFPGYGFDRNKGYGTAEHISALGSLGPSAVHRLSFQPAALQGALL